VSERTASGRFSTAERDTSPAEGVADEVDGPGVELVEQRQQVGGEGLHGVGSRVVRPG
jgi:hypothetical protein